MVTSWEEMSVRVQKSDLVANLPLRYKFRPNVLFKFWSSYTSSCSVKFYSKISNIYIFENCSGIACQTTFAYF